MAGLLGVLLVGAGCAGQKAEVKPAFDVSKIKRISVGAFDGAGGQAVADEFVRELVGTGIEVTDVHHPGDATLKGRVTLYKSQDALMIFLGSTSLVAPGGQTVTVDNPIVSPGGAQGLPDGSLLGVHNAQMASIQAVVGVQAQLLESGTGKLIWTGAFSYEALDLQGALQAVIGALTESMGAALPQLKKQTP